VSSIAFGCTLAVALYSTSGLVRVAHDGCCAVNLSLLFPCAFPYSDLPNGVVTCLPCLLVGTEPGSVLLWIFCGGASYGFAFWRSSALRRPFLEYAMTLA
jgi:hypothetical protein